MNTWRLTGARVALGAEEAKRFDIEVRAGRIAGLFQPGSRRTRMKTLNLGGCLVLPGLINAHDHLEFGLFPRLGRGPYPDALAWANAIYQPNCSPVKEQLQVPLRKRLLWGGVRNLLSGVTTVCHHNPYYRCFSQSFPVRVARGFGWAHSLQFSPDLRARHRRTRGDRPFVLHLGEATGRQGAREIHQLDAWGALDDRTVLVHGVAFGARELRLVSSRGARLVWCPSSNLFILGRTLDARAFAGRIPIALGTDSPLSAAGDLLDELRLARKIMKLPPPRLYGMVTSEAARVMKLGDGAGALEAGEGADILAVKDFGVTPAAALLRLRTATMHLVMVGGEVKLASAELEASLPARVRRKLCPVVVESARTKQRVFLAVPAAELFKQTGQPPVHVLLAGKRIHRAAH